MREMWVVNRKFFNGLDTRKYNRIGPNHDAQVTDVLLTRPIILKGYMNKDQLCGLLNQKLNLSTRGGGNSSKLGRPRLSRSLFFSFWEPQPTMLSAHFCLSAARSVLTVLRVHTYMILGMQLEFASCKVSILIPVHSLTLSLSSSRPPLVLLMLCCLIQESHPQVMWVMTCFQITSACPLICKEGIMLFILLFPGLKCEDQMK